MRDLNEKKAAAVSAAVNGLGNWKISLSKENEWKLA